MELFSRFIEHVKDRKLFAPGDRLLLAVSGGLDSVVLTHLCARAGYRMGLAHGNFGLRGDESNRDEAFVRGLATELGVSVHIKKWDTEQYARAHKCSAQVAARTLRYEWFDSLLQSNGEDNKRRYQALVTAHHSDDNVETVLMNFCKGTGMKGLEGIPEKRGAIIRPLLFASRKEIADYAAAAGLAWVEDSSNSEEKYTRNYFRHVVLPAIQKVIPEVSENMKDNLARFHEVGELYTQAVQTHKKKLMKFRGTEIHIPVLKLMQARPLKTILYELLKDYGFSPAQVASAEELLKSGSGRYIVSSTHRVLRNRAWIIISPLQGTAPGIVVVEEGAQEVPFDLGVLELRELNGPVELRKNGADEIVDAGGLEYPLLLRRWKAGDYFYPLGMSKKKKLSRFFIDQKLSQPDKEAVWVLESARRIVWVLGHRIDNRFRVTQSTRKALRLKIKVPGTASPKQGKHL